MLEKHNAGTINRPHGNPIMEGLRVNIDLPLLINQIKNEKAWEFSDRNAITIFKTDKMRIILIALHKGAHIIEHRIGDIMCLQILDGQMQFNTIKQSAKLSKGQMITLHEGIPHSLLAIEETVFLLTLTSSPDGEKN
jgi:quercetin dioxygenase-like cupin family protein